MIKLRQLMLRPKGLITIMMSSVLFLITISACDDDSGENSLGEILYIDGPGSVSPESTATYVASDYGGNVTWTVTGNASLTSSSELEAEITFGGVGEATVAASGNGFSGSYVVSIDAPEVAIELAFGKGATISEDASDALTFTFSGPLASTPSITLNGTVAGDTSAFYLVDDLGLDPYVTGTLSSLSEVSGSGMTKFTATYTATGADEGTTSQTLEAYIDGIEYEADYGGAIVDRQYFQLFAIDNVAPYGSFSVSDSHVNDSTEIVFSLALNEELRPVDGGAITVDVAYSSTSGMGETVTLEASEDDASVWTGKHVINGLGDGMLTATLDDASVVDVAGNAPLTGQLNNTADVTIDNTKPIPDLTASEVMEGSRFVEIVTSSNTDANAVQWIWLPGNSGFVPSLLSDFDGEGMGSTKFSADPGTYKIYFIEQDGAENISAIDSLINVVVTP